MTDDTPGRPRRTESAETDDRELLRRFAEEKSERAMAELVRRHIDLVHAAALRQTHGHRAMAEDVTQAVFVDLARRAGELTRHPALVGWLHTATRFAAVKTLRTESRRHGREAEARAMNEMLREADPPVDWARLQPALDEVLGELKERERMAILLRYFEKRSLAEVGAKLALSETAARSCVDRALEKMRAQFARRGVTSTSAALGVVLAGQAAGAAPAGLAASVTSAVLTGSAAAAGGGMIAIFMSMTKLQVGVGAALALAGGASLVVQTRANAELREEIALLREESAALAPLRFENGRLARNAAEAADLRGDDAELKRLGDESAALQQQWQQFAQARVATAAAATARGEVYDAAKLDHAPVVRSRVRPQYPADMRAAGAEGVVTVEFVVDRGGNVVNAVAAGSTRREFEAAAVDAVTQWEFSPGRLGDRKVNTRMREVIAFSMEKPAAPDGGVTVKGEGK